MNYRREHVTQLFHYLGNQFQLNLTAMVIK